MRGPACAFGDTDFDENIDILRSKSADAAVANGIEVPKGYKVSYHYNADVESHHFGRHHPMKPWRLTLTKQLVLSYGLQHAMELSEPPAATVEELSIFHKRDYVNFLARISPGNMNQFEEEMTPEELELIPKDRHPPRGEKLYKLPFNFGDDCPVFDGLYQYCSTYTGSTLSAARNLAADNPPDTGSHDIAINWSGGLHHAMKGAASGFCYINDIVLAIQELLVTHPRVLYIDLDVHHGDGVEAAFNSSDRVMTLSYHKYDPETFFPGTGALHDTGPKNLTNPGAYFSMNVPLHDGIDDDQFISLFTSITGQTLDIFRPTAIVLQCGADSLGGDRLGKFNLNIKAHGACVEFIKKQRMPTLILGGGGYTARNVARLWTHETALATGSSLPDHIPDFVPYRRAFETAENGDGLLYPSLSDVESRRHPNHNTPQYLDELVRVNFEHLRMIRSAPSVQMKVMPSPDEIWRIRQQVDAEMKEEMAVMESTRRDKERDVAGRGELPVGD